MGKLSLAKELKGDHYCVVAIITGLAQSDLAVSKQSPNPRKVDELPSFTN